MRAIDLITTETQKVKWITDEFKKKFLFVDNTFQREYVWLPKHQIRLIETILLGYSIPEIYLWTTDTDPDSGDSKYSIVDGQQRIGAVNDFIAGKFKLSPDYLDNKNASYSGKSFKELTPDEKRAIWDYPFSIRFIKREVQKDDIVAMFLRLNRTNMTLNPQELRNAEFEGLFIKLAEEIAQNDFWTDYKIFTPQKIRRMKDIEFISQLLIFLRKGVSGDTGQDAINEAYDNYNQEYQEYEQDKEMFFKMLLELKKIIGEVPSKVSFIRKTTHLYTFLVLMYFLIEKSQENNYGNYLENEQAQFEVRNIHEQEHFSKKVVFFIDYYDNTIQLKEHFNSNEIKIINKYKRSVTEGTQSKSKKIERIRLLKELFNI
ncbi:Protein of unknown function DUF262 [Bacillus sp. OK838]|nr:Protein of unknown function DUF262 [Bacillus sp. OK838]